MKITNVYKHLDFFSPNFLRSQHLSVIVELGISIPLVKSYPHPRWNFKKADWKSFAQELDKCLGWVPPVSKNYYRFCNAIISVAKKTIPRGYRKEYIPGWNPKCSKLYEKWTENVEKLDFKKSSKKSLVPSPKTTWKL